MLLRLAAGARRPSGQCYGAASGATVIAPRGSQPIDAALRTADPYRALGYRPRRCVGFAMGAHHRSTSTSMPVHSFHHR